MDGDPPPGRHSLRKESSASFPKCKYFVLPKSAILIVLHGYTYGFVSGGWRDFSVSLPWYGFGVCEDWVIIWPE